MRMELTVTEVVDLIKQIRPGGQSRHLAGKEEGVDGMTRPLFKYIPPKCVDIRQYQRKG